MVERELDGLIQDVLDEVATPAEAARLETRLSQDSAARERRNELALVFGAMSRSRRFEAPPELKSRILRALPAGAPGVQLVPSVERRRRFRLAYIFAAGLAAGVIAAGALTGFWKLPAPGNPAVLGTMAPSSPVATARWQAGSAQVESRIWRSAGSRLASFRVVSGPAEIELSFDPAALSCIAFRPAPGAPGATLEPGRVAFQGLERTETLVELAELPGKAEAPLRITVRSSGGVTSGQLPAPGSAPAR
jgi:hypothetical protein